MKSKAIIGALAGAGIVAAALAIALGPLASSASAAVKPSGMTPHHMGVRGAAHSNVKAAGVPLTYGGGPVETTPAVYIVYWGSQWSGNGFSTGGYSSLTAQTYVQDFFSNVGGSPWDNIDTQYCQGVAVGTVNCGSSGTHITNPTGQLMGVCTDSSNLPKRITQSGIAAEAVKSMTLTGCNFGYHANATYMVFTPSGHSMSGFKTSWCAWHSSTSSSSGTVAYAYIPYMPDAGANCGMNFINSNNAYGNGYFDGFSVVGGHEYAEAETDPHPSSGWTDSSGAENGDKCAWSSLSTNITLSNGHFYAVQPIWSNSASGCVTSA